MNIRIISLLSICGFLLPGMLMLSGCATVQDTIYMQSVSVSGPTNLPPIHLNNDSTANKTVLSPRLNMVKNDQIEGTVDENKYSLPGKNLTWEFPASIFGLDLDARLSSSIALSAGLNYAEIGQEGLLGGNAGLGFLFRGDDAAGRFELGLQFQSMTYDAATVVEQTVTSFFSSGSTTTIGYFHDINESTPLGYYGSLIVQSRNISRMFNIFGQLGLNRQPLTSFTPHTEISFIPGVLTYITTDTRTGTSATLLTFTPGVFFNVGTGSRFLMAVRMMKELEISDNISGILIQPVVQFDIGL
jgi:hypothetical protein